MSTACFVQDWLEGWNLRDVERILTHYADDATFQSPSPRARRRRRRHGARQGRNPSAVRAGARALSLRFELEEVIERPWGVLVLYRKHGVFAERPGLTIEAFEGHGAASRSA